MIKRLLKLLAVAPLLFAFQCDEDPGPMFTYNDYKVKISPSSSFAINETIWIEGRVSSQVYDLGTSDSIFMESPLPDVFSVFQFIEPTELANCKDALDKFAFVIDIGEYSFLPRCENATVQALPVLDDSEVFYSYRLGLKPLEAGDYVVSWQSSALQNTNRNEFIIEQYPIENHPDQLGFNSCGNVSWRNLDESAREFYFSVTP
jgi:hypothetical protein